MRRALILAAVLAAALPGTASAGLLPPQPIGANTGEDAVPVGTALGSRQAWAGFGQKTGGVNRLYVAYARDGRFRVPFLADRGNEVTGGALAGNRRGAAVAVFVEKVGNQSVLFGRRLSGGRARGIVQISAGGQDVSFEDFVATFDREHLLAMNERGAAASTATKLFGLLASGASQWVRHELPTGCASPGLDARGNVAVVGDDKDSDPAVSRVVGGQVRSEKLDPDGMDQYTLAVSPGGMGLAVGRNNDFKVIAYRKRDIAQDGEWDRLGTVEEGIIQANADPEDPFPALDPRGNGTIVFRDNSNNNPQGYYRLVRGGALRNGAKLYDSMARGRPAVDRRGNPFVAYSANDFKSAFLNRFARGQPGPALPLAPGLEPYFVPCLPCIAVSDPGDVLVVFSQGANPIRIDAVFGDFAPPRVRPRVKPKRPRAGQRVTLSSGVADDFAAVRKRDVRWGLPPSARPTGVRTGSRIRVRFPRPGRYTIGLIATDRGGNQARKTVRLRVR